MNYLFDRMTEEFEFEVLDIWINKYCHKQIKQGNDCKVRMICVY